ncbi:MAG: hypothetical protein A2Y97_06810 [Nitrospirae bacterium RBG_13_39_12]|nr:MAG: hypothetical protein A2Y97_06810 [Nitrospirae bacterium RBG_13_39_12]
MTINYFKRLFLLNKELIIEKVLEVKGLMQLLMKYRNTGQKWSIQEKIEIKMHLKNIARIIPALGIFLLPGGFLFLPFLADIIDRRKTKRN